MSHRDQDEMQQGIATSPGQISVSCTLSNPGVYNYDIFVIKCTDVTNPYNTQIDSQWYKATDAGFLSDDEQSIGNNNYQISYSMLVTVIRLQED